MSHILSKYGLGSRIIYSKDSYDYENKEMYGVCELKKYMTRTAKIANELTEVGLQDYLKSIKYSIVLDTQDPNELLSYYNLIKDSVILYIDHHEHINNEENNESTIKLYKDKAGATVSILLDYMTQKEYDLKDPELSNLRVTAYRGLETDTNNFNEKSMSQVDIKAKEYLEQFLTDEDFGKIEKIKNYVVNEKMEMALYRALGEREIRENLILYIIPEVIKNDPGRV